MCNLATDCQLGRYELGTTIVRNIRRTVAGLGEEHGEGLHVDDLAGIGDAGGHVGRCGGAAGLEALANLHEDGETPHAAALERLKRELGAGVESIDLLFSL